MDSGNTGNWFVNFSKDAKKQVLRLRKEQPAVYAKVAVLAKEIETCGPVRKNWKNFGPLFKGKGIPENSYHCHIKSGRPTYVACWCVEDKKVNIVEVYYVGTHEKAPY